LQLLGVGDPRVEARGKRLFEQMVSTGSVVLRKLGAGRAGEVAAQRFLSSPRATVDGILEAASADTRQACRGRRVLVAQDTTELSFARAGRRRGLGPAGNGKTPGFFIHAQVGVDIEDEAVLGLVGAKIWTREPGRVGPRHSRAIEDKESLRWIEGARTAAERLGSAAQVVVAGDQEADLWTHFARRPQGCELLVRARHDRDLGETGSLFTAPASWPELARYQITIAPRAVGEKPRTTTVAVRAGTVAIRRPASCKEGPASIELGLVEAREVEEPPPGREAVLWRLLTSLPVTEAEQAMEVVRLYRLRWRIEEVFRTLKKDGLRLEETQVCEAEHLFRLAALALAASVRILQLVDARDGGPRPMSDVLDQNLAGAVAVIGRTREGGTERQKNPHPEGSLAWLSWIVARFGGWNCYGKPPGPKTMGDGWKSFHATLSGYLIATGQLP
jgi:hypothetical protein